jgi:hypothetical protein
MPEIRWCSVCEQYKPVSDFYRRGASWMSECKICNKVRHLALPRRDRHAENEAKRAKRHIIVRRLEKCEYCPHLSECKQIVLTSSPLKCAPGSGVEVVRPKASELQSNWRMAA